ncbi:MAG: phage portal protein [Holosporales bacterium]|nr:phage portal protein [Holosporales bacterium]
MFNNFFKNYVRNDNVISSIVDYKTNNNYNGKEYTDLADIGYQNNVIVYRCVHIISRSVASVAWTLREYDHKVKASNSIHQHSILDLIARPNARQSRTSFVEAAVSYLLLSGNCYVQAIKNDETGEILELHLLRPDRVRVIPGLNSIPKCYEYSVGENKTFFMTDENGFSDILHIKLFSPLNDWYGYSPVAVVMNAITQHNAITKQNISFLKNGGRPSGALIYKSTFDSVQRENLKNDLKNAYEGGKNAGKILLLEGDFEWKEMGLSPKDLDFMSGKELSSKEIALAFGVPSILIGSTADATFSNYKEARYNFWEETVLPMLSFITSEFTNWFRYIFKNNEISILYDIDSIQALSKRRESEWKKINNATFLTDNEKREALGFSLLDYDDDDYSTEETAEHDSTTDHEEDEKIE